MISCCCASPMSGPNDKTAKPSNIEELEVPDSPRDELPSKDEPPIVEKLDPVPVVEKQEEQLPPVQAPEECAGEAAIFTCTIEKASADLGWVVDHGPIGFQVIEDVKVGAVAAYNDMAPNEYKIRRYDLIVAINGLKEFSAMAATARDPKVDKLEMMVLRPSTVSVRIDKGASTWGLNLSFQENRSICLRVKSVDAGGVQTYNETAEPGLDVKANDFILSFNGVSGTGSRLLKEMTSKSSVGEVVILRYPLESGA